MAPYRFAARLRADAVPLVQRFLATGRWEAAPPALAGATQAWHAWLHEHDRYGYEDGRLVLDASLPGGAARSALCVATRVWEAEGDLPGADARDTARALDAFVRLLLRPASEAVLLGW